jgi:VacB/RNase II family 3'-5' exoribonuclease
MNKAARDGLKTLRAVAHRTMIEYGLEPDFPVAAIKQLDAIQSAAESGTQVRDLRAMLWASIDNDDSRDLDQLSVAEPLPDGTVKIFVSIADVDSLVQAGTALDEHAQANTTSVYTAAQIFPMLPERLSTDFTSLGEDQDRLSIVIEMAIAPDGTLKSSSLYRASVRNKAKLAYNSVAAWLDGKGPAPPRVASVRGLDEQLRVQDRVAQSLKHVRHLRGALSLETIEARAVIDNGVLVDLRPDEKNRAKDLIEDFMIAANGVAAEFLAGKGFPVLRRVLRVPERWPRIVALARTHGGNLPAAPDALALNRFLLEQRDKDPTRFPDLSLAVVKLLGSGEYVLQKPGQQVEGHFGLAVLDYTHSTAPNRRYPDLITQRLLKAALAGRPVPYADAELAGLATHCTTQEDNAAKVERVVRKSAAALLLESRIGQTFDAIVTGAGDKGVWVRTCEPTAEGKLVRGFQGVDVGDRVRVRLVATDVDRGYIDFATV